MPRIDMEQDFRSRFNIIEGESPPVRAITSDVDDTYSSGSFNVVKFHLYSLRYCGKHSLHMAIMAGDVGNVRRLLHKGVDVNQYYIYRTWEYMTPFVLAVRYKQVHIAKVLLEEAMSLDVSLSYFYNPANLHGGEKVGHEFSPLQFLLHSILYLRNEFMLPVLELLVDKVEESEIKRELIYLRAYPSSNEQCRRIGKAVYLLLNSALLPSEEQRLSPAYSV